MSRSSAREAQTEPLAALAAVLVVGLAVGLYADAMAAVEPAPAEGATADAVLQSVYDAITEDGAARPGRVPAATAAGPPGRDVNVTLSAGGRTWRSGPTPPSDAADADRRTPVRLDRWTVRPGRLQVVVWS